MKEYIVVYSEENELEEQLNNWAKKGYILVSVKERHLESLGEYTYLCVLEKEKN